MYYLFFPVPLLTLFLLAFIHVIGDFVQTIGVLIAGIIIWVEPSLVIADPICTFIFSIIVLVTTIGILRDTLHVLMEGVPLDVEIVSVVNDLRAIPGVADVHDLHIWSITMGRAALTVHLRLESGADAAVGTRVLHEAERVICGKYKIHHTTIQIETTGATPLEQHCGSCNNLTEIARIGREEEKEEERNTHGHAHGQQDEEEDDDRPLLLN